MCEQSLLKEFLSPSFSSPPPSASPAPSPPAQAAAAWVVPPLSTLVSCCLAANNRRCLQSNLPLPWPMGAGALFHQTSLFRICREANRAKCYRYEIGVDLTRATHTHTATTTTTTLLASPCVVSHTTRANEDWRIFTDFGA